MKTILALILTLILQNPWSAVAGESAVPLARHQQGKVVYFVSEPNKLIHLHAPFSVDLTLIDNVGLPNDSRYTLSINGKIDPLASSQDIDAIKTKYPGFAISNRSGSGAVRGCKITLSNGVDVECNTPPATGNYFSTFTLLGKSDGDLLKRDIQQHRSPTFQIETEYDEPIVSASEEITIPLMDFYSRIANNKTNLDLRGVIKAIAQITGKLKLSGDSPLYSVIGKILMDECVSKDLPEFSSVSTVAELLSVRVIPKFPTENFKLYRSEELGWKSVKQNGLLQVQMNFIEAK